MNILSIVGAILMIGGVGGAELGTSLLWILIQEIFGGWLIARNIDLSSR